MEIVARRVCQGHCHVAVETGTPVTHRTPESWAETAGHYRRRTTGDYLVVPPSPSDMYRMSAASFGHRPSWNDCCRPAGIVLAVAATVPALLDDDWSVSR